MSLMELLGKVKDKQGGFLLKEDVTELAKLDRLRQLLVRCGQGRFLVAAQDCLHYCEMVDTHATDYVRDISLPSSDSLYRGEYRNYTDDYHADFVMPKPQPRSVTVKVAPAKHAVEFREECCGGVFDGFGVVSDADPGL